MSSTRRDLLALGGASLLVTGCDRLANDPGAGRIVRVTEGLTRRAQRIIPPRAALAHEFGVHQISSAFRANGNTDPQNEDYQRHSAARFASWKLEVGGLVDRPLSLSLADLRAAPARTQITRHDCVEGWSAIAQWTGAQLWPILQRAGLRRQARYIAFYCADSFPSDLIGSGQYYETIDLEDAAHPQTILAYEMNGKALPVAYGAPLRLRVERQLGYKMAKYIMRIEAIAGFSNIEGGAGGYWEDRGYEWYAGI